MKLSEVWNRGQRTSYSWSIFTCHNCTSESNKQRRGRNWIWMTDHVRAININTLSGLKMVSILHAWNIIEKPSYDYDLSSVTQFMHDTFLSTSLLQIFENLDKIKTFLYTNKGKVRGHDPYKYYRQINVLVSTLIEVFNLVNQ